MKIWGYFQSTNYFLYWKSLGKLGPRTHQGQVDPETLWILINILAHYLLISSSYWQQKSNSHFFEIWICFLPTKCVLRIVSKPLECAYFVIKHEKLSWPWCLTSPLDVIHSIKINFEAKQGRGSFTDKLLTESLHPVLCSIGKDKPKEREITGMSFGWSVFVCWTFILSSDIINWGWVLLEQTPSIAFPSDISWIYKKARRSRYQ